MKQESGAVTIVEATIVFPIMFFILLFILFLGNIYYQQARIDDIVAKYAIKGAQRIVNPIQDQLEKGNSLEIDSKKINVQPYRNLMGKMSGIKKEIANEVYKEITKKGLTILGNNPEMNASQVVTNYRRYVIYGDFSVEASYQIRFPIKFIWSDEVYLVKSTSHAKVVVNDTPEFVRNVDLVVDLFHGTKVETTIQGAFKKINEFINSFAKKDEEKGEDKGEEKEEEK